MKKFIIEVDSVYKIKLGISKKKTLSIGFIVELDGDRREGIYRGYFIHNVSSADGINPRTPNVMNDYGFDYSWWFFVSNSLIFENGKTTIDENFLSSIHDKSINTDYLVFPRLFDIDEYDFDYKKLKIYECEKMAPLDIPNLGGLFFFSNKYSKNVIYRGKRAYHESHRTSNWMNSPIKKPNDDVYIGVELEMEASDHHKMNTIRSNILFPERDGSLSMVGFEWISIPLLPEDAMSVEFWKSATDILSSCAYVDDKCGMHIHISKAMFDVDGRDNMAKLELFYEWVMKPTSLNTVLNGRKKGYNESRLNLSNPNIGLMVMDYPMLPSIKEKAVNDVMDASMAQRYLNVNISNSNTIEFRLGAGTLDPEKIASLTTYYYCMMKYIKGSNWENFMNYDKFINYINENVPSDSPLLKTIKKEL